MNWELILQVTVPTFALMAFVWNRLEKRSDRIENRIDRLENRLDNLDNKLDVISQKQSRFEGRFEERGYWEARKNGTEKK